MSDKSSNLIYSVDERPPLNKLIILGLQYVMLMSIYLIIISVYFTIAKAPPEIIRSAISMGMIALAISTILQAIKKGPIGSGFLAAPVISAIYLEGSLLAIKHGGIPALLGMTIFAGFIELFISIFIKRLRLLFPPGISGLIITVVGLKIGVLGITKVLDISNFYAPTYVPHLLLAIFTLSTMIGFSIWGKGLVRLTCSMTGLVIGIIAAIIFHLLPANSTTLLEHASWIGIPNISYISYHIDFTLIPTFTIAGVAAALRTVGVVTSCQVLNDPNWRSPQMKSIKGGVLADAIGNIIAGFLGSPGMNTGPSLVGASKAAGATSRYIAFMAAIFLIVFAFIPKFSAFFSIVPFSVIGAALVFTGGFMIVGGIQIMAFRQINIRMTYIIGISLLVGLSHEIYPGFYKELPYFVRLFSDSFLSLTVICAILLNLVFRIGIKQKANITVGKDKISSYNEAQEIFNNKAKEWLLPENLQDRASKSIKQILTHLRENKSSQEEITIAATYDTINLVIEFRYEGDLLTLFSFKQKKKELIEEEAFAWGLTKYLDGVYPDNIKVITKNNIVSVSLYFYA